MFNSGTFCLGKNLSLDKLTPCAHCFILQVERKPKRALQHRFGGKSRRELKCQAGCGILEGEMQLPAQVPHYKQAFLPIPPPQLSLCLPRAPGTPGKVVPIQSWDQYSCQAPATLPLLIGITIGRLQLSLHLSVACHNVIKISLSLYHRA